MDDDNGLRLGLLGALLAFSTLFVHVPAVLWSGNAAEFHFRFTSFLGPALAALALVLAAVFVVLRLVPPRARLGIACALAAIGVLWWMEGALLAGQITALDGRHVPRALRAPATWPRVALTAAAGAILWGTFYGFRRAAVLTLALLNVGLGLTTTATLLAARQRAESPFAQRLDDAIFRYSSARNVLVVLLDGLQADIAARVLQDDTALREKLDGFSFFTDTSGVAPTTFLSIPAIHSGEVYRANDWLGPYFTRAITRDSFVNRFADAGYATTLINPVEGICPERVAICTSAERILRSPAAQLRLDARRLLDVSLLRVSPSWLKPSIYNDGQWLFSGHVEMGNQVSADAVNRSFDVSHQLLDGLRLFQEMTQRMEADSSPPTLKFIHSFVTHPPYVLEDDCRPTDDVSARHVVFQARCALTAVAELLDGLKQAGIYDNTVVLLLADHGLNPDLHYRVLAPDGAFNEEGETEEHWSLLAGSAHPAFLLKPLGQRGALTMVDGAVYLADVGATLCAATADCSVPSGIPAGEAPLERPRRFNDYVWHHEYWTERYMPTVTAYDIRGPVTHTTSWYRVAEQEVPEPRK